MSGLPRGIWRSRRFLTSQLLKWDGQEVALKGYVRERVCLPVPHRRQLRRQWVLISPHRTQRPWQGEVNPSSGFSDLHYDPACYLCPGNERAGGHLTPRYESVFIFDNDYAALLPDSPAPRTTGMPALLRAEQERGLCRVLCFHPDHSLTVALMDEPDICV